MLYRVFFQNGTSDLVKSDKLTGKALCEELRANGEDAKYARPASLDDKNL